MQALGEAPANSRLTRKRVERLDEQAAVLGAGDTRGNGACERVDMQCRGTMPQADMAPSRAKGAACRTRSKGRRAVAGV